MEVDIGFSMLKSKEQNTEEEKKTCQRRSNMPKESKKETCRKKAKKGER
jgi:hypothetical protein